MNNTDCTETFDKIKIDTVENSGQQSKSKTAHKNQTIPGGSNRTDGACCKRADLFAWLRCEQG